MEMNVSSRRKLTAIHSLIVADTQPLPAGLRKIFALEETFGWVDNPKAFPNSPPPRNLAPTF
jgi:hypothetical protein